MKAMPGAELKARREALHLSVVELAELLDVTRITLHRWEREGVRERVAMLRLALLALEMQQGQERLARKVAEDLAVLQDRERAS